MGWRDDKMTVIKSNFIDLRHVLNNFDYESSVREFRELYNIHLPKINLFKNTPIFILLNDLSIVIKNLDNKATPIYRYEFKKGFMTDLASVPKCLQSIVQNDDPDVVLAAFVHDVNFTLKFFGSDKQGYEYTNKLFKQMIKNSIFNRNKDKGLFNKIKDNLYFAGVNTNKAWKFYKTDDPYKDFYKDFVKFSIV